MFSGSLQHKTALRRPRKQDQFAPNTLQSNRLQLQFEKLSTNIKFTQFHQLNHQNFRRYWNQLYYHVSYQSCQVVLFYGFIKINWIVLPAVFSTSSRKSLWIQRVCWGSLTYGPCKDGKRIISQKQRVFLKSTQGHSKVCFCWQHQIVDNQEKNINSQQVYKWSKDPTHYSNKTKTKKQLVE